MPFSKTRYDLDHRVISKCKHTQKLKIFKSMRTIYLQVGPAGHE